MIKSTTLQSSLVRKPVEILFVGNSFTHGHTEPAQFFNSPATFDLNGTRYGGVPGIFQRMSADAGLCYRVAIEATCGQTLEGHFEKKSEIIGSSAWDVVVLQELSTGPLPKNRGGDPVRYFEGVENLARLLRASNPSVQIFLYETWASPASVCQGGYGAAGGLRRMQEDLEAAICAACDRFRLDGVVRVGEAFMQAVEQGIAAAEPGQAGVSGRVNLWAEDGRHAGVHGSLLAAAVFFAHLAGVDADGAHTSRVAGELGVDKFVAESLCRVARDVAAQSRSIHERSRHAA